jgi:acyl carrier protein
MTDKEIVDLVNKTLAEEFELDPASLRPEAGFAEDLGLDSLDTVDMIIVLEQAFRMKIRDNEAIRGIRTLGDLHAFLIEARDARGA